MEKYYHPSGKYSPKAFFFAFASLLLVFPLTFLHVYSGFFLHETTIQLLNTFIYSFLVAIIFSIFVIKKGLVRNEKLAGRSGILFGIIAFYFYWFFLLILLSKGNHFSIFALSFSDLRYLQPNLLFDLSQNINAAEKLIIWPWFILKGIFIIFLSRQAGKTAASKPFSEKNGIWFKDKKVFVNFIEDKDGFVSDLENGRYEVLDQLEKRDGKSESHAVFTSLLYWLR